MPITHDLQKLLEILPQEIQQPLQHHPQCEVLVEVVLDLGRRPEARFPNCAEYLSDEIVTHEQLQDCIDRVGSFGADNRAGIEQTLHRISAIRNRKGDIIGLTCRVGRAIFGTIAMIRDLVETGQSILMLGRPGVGKTTALREIARVLADELHKRVVIIDSSNEIAGDGDIPHPAIGRARRMQVARPELQHQVMIEAVENHMPEVIVIDEIGTELEALAARTIAERGVQLVGTAHGNQLENLIKNPTLSDLVGGIQSVTLGDDEARRRGSQKSVLERKASPTFEIAVEMQERQTWTVHENVADTVDHLLRQRQPDRQMRTTNDQGQVTITRQMPYAPMEKREASQRSRPRQVLALPKQVTGDAAAVRERRFAHSSDGDRNFDREPQADALLGTTLVDLAYTGDAEDEWDALEEARLAVEKIVIPKGQPVELLPRSAPVRKLQHEFIEHYQLKSSSFGTEPNRRLRIYPA
jgi:stage III sporulation protein SpoIIIAA